MINVLLAEDHNIVRNGIKLLLENEPDINVVGEAANGNEAIQLLEELDNINLVLTDLNMPGMSGNELIKHSNTRFANVKIVVLSMSDHEKYVLETFNAGANGFLLKNVSKDELIFAIKHVVAGEKYICAELSIRMFEKLSSNESVEHNGFTDFTKRELEVLKLIANGLTNNEIAEKLFTSRRTVEGHRQSLIEKTGVSNSAALIMHSFRNGIIK